MGKYLSQRLAHSLPCGPRSLDTLGLFLLPLGSVFPQAATVEQFWSTFCVSGNRPVDAHCPHYCPYLIADKYCPLLIKEGGMPLLRDLIKMATARQETKEMAR